MLNSIFYLIDNTAQSSRMALEKNDPNFFLSFVIDPLSIIKIKEAYQFLNNEPYINFSLTINLRSSPDTEVLYFLISFFFLPNYTKINNTIIIHFTVNEEALFVETKNKFLALSERQGIKNLSINNLSEHVSKTLMNGSTLIVKNLVLYNTIDFITDYKKILQSANFYNNTFYIKDLNSSAEQIYLLIEEAEKELCISKPLLYESILNLQSVARELEIATIKNASLLNELENYKKHITMLQSHHEAKELQNYYDKEYEVLPLWYKRIGHVIKVVIGKRNFKSLFNK